MKVFLSCVSSEFRSYRLKLANQLGALKGQPFEVKVQEDFEQGRFTLLDKLADYIRECDLVIHLAGDASGAQPTSEHVRTMFAHLNIPAPEPLPERSFTQWEYDLAIRFGRRMFCYVAAPEALRDYGPIALQSDVEAKLQTEHKARFEREGKHYETCSGPADLVRRVFYDLGLEAKLKIDNLPYKSLGSLFKGREDFLAQLRETLGAAELRGHQKIAAITASATAATVYGLGGIGKTRTALEYAHRYADEYTALLFVQADSPSGLQQNLAQLCGPMVLDLAEKDAKETEVQVAAVLQWLQGHPGWFLILDNVDTEEAALAVQGVLARLSRAGQVVITSRLSNWESGVETLALDVLSVEAAAEFLLERTEGKRRKQADDAEQVRTLAAELGQLALALEQAGAYIVRYRSTFAGYLEEWRKRHERVLEWFDERTMQYPRSVAITWQTSFDRLSEPTRQLLRLLSWLAPDPIPESMLDVGGGPFGAGTQDDFAGVEAAGAVPNARDALAELANYSLVKWSDEEPTFSVHRLVQDVTRRTLPEGERLACLKQAMRWVNDAFAGDPQEVLTWPVLAPLLPHVQAVTIFADRHNIAVPTAQLMNQAGLLFKEKAQFAEAEPLYRRALAINEDAYGPDHPEVAEVLNNLANLLRDINHLDEAELLYRRALAIEEQFYGPDHLRVSTKLGNLARLLTATNQFAEAERLYRRALAIREMVYGPDDPNVALFVSNLAVLLLEAHRLAEAEPMLRRALAIEERSQGVNHPRVASALNNLALLLQNTNRPMEAEPLYRRALAIHENTYGSDHPHVAICLNNLATLLKETNRLTEAEPLMRRALAIDESSYGPFHPNVARDLNNLAVLLQTTNRPAEAETLLRRVLEIDERSFRSDHPKVALHLARLAGLLYVTKRYAEAEPLMRRALAIDEKCYGLDHPEVASDLNNLAHLLHATNRLAEAEPLARRVLAIWEHSLEPDHPYINQSMEFLARLLERTGRWGEAAPLRQRIIEAQERKLGSEHPDTIRSWNNFSSKLRRHGLFDQAELISRRVFATTAKTLGEAHALTVHRRDNLVLSLILLDNLAEARELLRENWQIKAESFANTTPCIVVLMYVVALLELRPNTLFLGQLKTLLTGPELPVASEVAFPWDIAYFFEYLRSKLAPGSFYFLTALVAALNDRAQLSALDGFPEWSDQPLIPLDVPWPAE